MSDIVERLNRAGDLAIPGEPCGLYYDAANEIELLRQQWREMSSHMMELRRVNASLRAMICDLKSAESQRLQAE